MRASLLLVFMLLALTQCQQLSQAEQQNSVDFLTTCNSLVNEEIFFTGVCSSPGSLLGKLADLVAKAPGSEPLDMFIRNRILNELDDFLRDNYENQPEFAHILDLLRAQILKFIDELVKPDCLEKLTLEKFAEPFYESGFSKILSSIKSHFNDKHPSLKECGSGGKTGFCYMTKNMLNIEHLKEFTNMKLIDILRTLIDKIYKNDLLNNNGKKAFDNLLAKIQTDGTELTFVSDVREFTDSDLYLKLREEAFSDKSVSANVKAKPEARESEEWKTEFIIAIVFLSVGGALLLLALIYCIYSSYCVRKNFATDPGDEVYNLKF